MHSWLPPAVANPWLAVLAPAPPVSCAQPETLWQSLHLHWYCSSLRHRRCLCRQSRAKPESCPLPHPDHARHFLHWRCGWGSTFAFLHGIALPMQHAGLFQFLPMNGVFQTCSAVHHAKAAALLDQQTEQGHRQTRQAATCAHGVACRIFGQGQGGNGRITFD